MTPPMTPREKVEQPDDLLFYKLKDLITEQSEGEWDDATIARDAHHFANHLRPLFERATALASGSGDQAELAGLICWLGDAADAECDRDQKSGLRKAAACLEAVRIERDTAQSAVEAWAHVCEGLEAHLEDRVAMQDVADPERYLRIIRSNIARVQKDSEQIRAARWADYRRHETRATEAERKLADERLNYEGALSDIDSLLSVLIRRINGEKDLASAAEWVRLNYPLAAEKIISKEAERG